MSDPVGDAAENDSTEDFETEQKALASVDQVEEGLNLPLEFRYIAEKAGAGTAVRVGQVSEGLLDSIMSLLEGLLPLDHCFEKFLV